MECEDVFLATRDDSWCHRWVKEELDKFFQRGVEHGCKEGSEVGLVFSLLIQILGKYFSLLIKGLARDKEVFKSARDVLPRAEKTEAFLV